MLRPFWCNDSTTTLRTLDDWLATHGDLSQSPNPPMEGRCLKNRATLRNHDQLLLQFVRQQCCGSRPTWRRCRSWCASLSLILPLDDGLARHGHQPRQECWQYGEHNDGAEDRQLLSIVHLRSAIPRDYL